METNQKGRAYTFGIELEYMLKLKDPAVRRQNLTDGQVFGLVAKMWNNSGRTEAKEVQMEANQFGRAITYETWQVVSEPSLEPSEDNDERALEFVSPIFHYGRFGEWQRHIKSLAEFLSRNFERTLNDSMGLHIHVAPEGRGWTLKELQQIAVAIAHFHGPLRRVFPWHRYTEAYTKCNIAENLTLRDKNFEVIAKMIRDADTIDKLIWVMNPPAGNKFDSRKYAWNFTNNTEDKQIWQYPKKTMEFRSPRSTKDYQVMKKWIVFTVTFLHASVMVSQGFYKDYSRDLDGLKKFLLSNRPPGAPTEFSWDSFKFQDAV